MSTAGIVSAVYRHRWALSALLVTLVVTLFIGGTQRLNTFSAQVEALKEIPSTEAPPPRIFDARFDIWFDPTDSGLRTFKDIEDRFVAEDVLIVAFEETEDPWGAFGSESLEVTARLTQAIEQIPYVRNVRGLTSNPWIRWGQAGDGEDGLVVSDLFENDIDTYSSRDRLERMIAVLGAERASHLAGVEVVRQHLGAGAIFDDYIGEPRLIDSIISADGRTTALQVQVLRITVPEERLDAVFGPDALIQRAIGPATITNEAQWDALASIQELAAKENRPVHTAGMPAMELNSMIVGMSDTSYVGVMFVVIGFVLFLVYRTIGGVSLPLVVVFSAIIGMLGSVFLAGDLLNNVTAIAPNMVTAVGIADAVHLVTMYYLIRPQFTDRHLLIQEVLRRNWLPIFLTSVTTAIGFFSLTTSELVPLRMLGYTGGIGTLFAYFLSITLVPALLSLIPVHASEQQEASESSNNDSDSSHWSGTLVQWVVERRTGITLVSVLAAALSAWGITQVEVTTDFRTMFPEDDKHNIDLRWIESRLGGTGDLEIVFFGPDLKAGSEKSATRTARIEALQIQKLESESDLPTDAIAELSGLQAEESAYQRRRIAVSHDFLQRVDRFSRKVKTETKDPSSPLRVFTSFDSALSVLRKMHQVQNQNRAAFYRIPTSEDIPEGARKPILVQDEIMDESFLIPAQDASSLAAQYYLQYENGAKPSESLATLITADRRGFRITARVNSASASLHQAAYDRLREIARTDFPEMAADGEIPTGSTAMSSMTLTGKHYLFTNMVQSFSATLMTSLGLAISLITFLIALFFRSAILGLLSLVPNLLPLVMPLGFMGIFGIALDGPAVLVCAVALGVCVDDSIHFLSKFTQALDEGHDIETALRRAYRQVGAALTWTTVVLMLGFAVLTQSSFRPNSVIGSLGVIMIGLAWIADFIVLPALLTFTHSRKRNYIPENRTA